MQVVKVNLGTRAYPVVIGPGALAYAGRCLKLLSRSRRVFMFCDAQVFALHRHSLRAAFKRSGVTTEEMVVPIGEQAKSRAVVNRMHDFLLDKKISRTDFILACGGGVTSDVVGYAAATVLRGVPWGIISTTLLGMVDAAIGGKTGINHPRGKNLIGCFYQPTFVVCDTDFLNTLEDRQSIAGAGEIVKYGGLIGDKMLTVIDRFLAQNNWRHERLLTQLIHLSAAYKAAVVARDEQEHGLRMHLNLGHTFAHGIENSLGYGRLLHGEAVVLGLLAAVELSWRMAPKRANALARYRETIGRVMRRIPYRRIDVDAVLRSMQMDKKRAGAAVRFVVLDKPGRVKVVSGVRRELVISALESALNEYGSIGGRHAAYSHC